MTDHSALLPASASLRIDDRVRQAEATRTARIAAGPHPRRHRLADRLRAVAERLDS